MHDIREAHPRFVLSFPITLERFNADTPSHPVGPRESKLASVHISAATSDEAIKGFEQTLQDLATGKLHPSDDSYSTGERGGAYVSALVSDGYEYEVSTWAFHHKGCPNHPTPPDESKTWELVSVVPTQDFSNGHWTGDVTGYWKRPLP